MLAVPSDPSPNPPWCWQDHLRLTARMGVVATQGTLLECFTRFVTSSRFLVGYGWWDSEFCTQVGQDTQSSDFTSHEAIGVQVPDRALNSSHVRTRAC